MKRLTFIAVLICLVLIAGCDEARYDFESEELARVFASGKGNGYAGVNLAPEGKASWKDLAADIFKIKEQFLSNNNFHETDESEEARREWFKFLKNELRVAKNDKMNKYLIDGRGFLEQFRKLYQIEMDQLKWDDRDWDGNPNWNDPDTWEYKEENK